MGELTLFVPLIIGLGFVMFLSSRRQKKAMQATIDLHESLSIGDRVTTSSGLEGTITDIGDDTVDVENDDDDEPHKLTEATDVAEQQATADPAPSPKTDS